MHQAKAVFMMVVYDTPESWLRQAIESVLHQTCPDLYFLIQDNGSTGRTAEILREYAGRDTRIVLFRNEVNNAMTPEENAAWWNLVCRYTLELESEYFAVLDSDDSYAPDFLEVMYQIATEKQADLVVCGTTMVDESGEKTLRERLPPALALERREMSASQFAQEYGSFRSVWGKLFRASLLWEYGNGFVQAASQQVRNGADTFCILYLMRKITRFVSVPKSLHTYRIRNASVYQGTQGELSPNRVREGEQLFLAACQTAKSYSCLNWEAMHFLYDVYHYHIHDLLASLLDNPSMSPESKVSYFHTVLDAPLFAQIGETSNRMVWLVDQMFLRLLTPAPPLPLEYCCSLLHRKDSAKQDIGKRQLLELLDRDAWEQARRVEAALVVQCPLDEELLYLRLRRMAGCGEDWENARHAAQIARLLYPENTAIGKLAESLES